MIRALLIVRDDPRDFGIWQLAALPIEGHVMVIGVNDRPAFFRVLNVFHVPVPAAGSPEQNRQALPYVAIGLEPYSPPEMPNLPQVPHVHPDSEQWRE